VCVCVKVCVCVCVVAPTHLKNQKLVSNSIEWMNTQKSLGLRVRTGLQGRKKKYNVPLILSHVAQRLYFGIPMPPSREALVLPDEEEVRMHSMVQQTETGWDKDRDSEHPSFASMPRGEMNLDNGSSSRNAAGSGSGGGSNHTEVGETIIKTVSV
jgi:hypothetical protein